MTATSWVKIASENQTAQVAPGSTLRFGVSAENQFVQRTDLSGAVVASVAVFGEPAKGLAKSLYLEMAEVAQDPTVYAYTGPQPPVPPASSVNWDTWNVYLRVENLRVEAAKISAINADRESRDQHRKATDAHREQLLLLTQAMHDQPQVIQQGPLTLRALALQLMIDTPRKPNETPDQLAQRAVAEANALMRHTP